jgi:hypothetical protein
MGTRDERETEPSKPEGSLTLVDAIQQILKTRELLGETQNRIRSLEKQRSHTRQQTLLEALGDELEALKNTARRVAGEAEQMAKFFSEMRIVINGRSMAAEEAIKILASLKQHADGLAHLLASFEVETLGIPRLVHSYGTAKRAIEECAETWSNELVAFVLLLEGVKIPDKAIELFQCVWLNRNSTVRMYIKWKASEKRWVPDAGTEPTDPRLAQFMRDASQLTSTQGLPDGFAAWVDCETDIDGKVTFRIRTRSPNDAHAAAGGVSVPGNPGPVTGHVGARVDWRSSTRSTLYPDGP